ncbi:threonine-phosphate decarboxylase CobD [Psychromonas sp. Urea-02u-13]|uniref:threonine-phosphate decarboxylase CobD n=1 Tax=Psychromonas sp. Urea-02u-13 TaxID=2058326 RepID=UPI000C322BF6|nr:threonine-phosphate decarboxylase CobD [Psychromonas sp. Urea-02u-13]PKG40965.1 threonine-phosphate decarboxylase [Psychromonas sp. Urea-02u-13]
MAILHGGQLSRVALQYNIPETQWLDLSTGIAPFSYPITDIPLKVWQDLPTVSEQFLHVAKQYYQAQYCWPVSGSQALIEKLPALWRKKHPSAGHVYLPKVGYKEHQHAWQQAGYELHFYQKNLPKTLHENAVVVVINPNNPLTDTFSIKQLSQLQQRCDIQNSLLIIDEAFADIFEPAFSFVTQIKADTDNVIVLRSFGKFFGLAGLRIGFACCSLSWFEIIKTTSGPWAVNGPALYIAEQALQDKSWQQAQTKRLQTQSQQLQSLLESALMVSRIEANALFMTVFLDNAPAIYDQLCQKAIYVRLTDENDALRFGIADEIQLARLRLLLEPSSLIKQ